MIFPKAHKIYRLLPFATSSKETIIHYGNKVNSIFNYVLCKLYCNYVITFQPFWIFTFVINWHIVVGLISLTAVIGWDFVEILSRLLGMHCRPLAKCMLHGKARKSAACRYSSKWGDIFPYTCVKHLTWIWCDPWNPCKTKQTIAMHAGWPRAFTPNSNRWLPDSVNINDSVKDTSA